MKRMDVYLARSVVMNALMVLLVLAVLASVMTFVSEMHAVTVSPNYTLLDAATYTLLKVPGGLYDMFTVAVMLGALLGLGDLAVHNELTVLRVAGVSVARLGAAAMFGGVLLALLCVLIGEFVAPLTEKRAEDRRAELVLSRSNTFGAGGVWAKDGNSFVNITAVQGRDTATGIYIFDVDTARQVQSIVSADSAVFSHQHASLNAVSGTRFDASGATAFKAPHQSWQTLLDPALINLFAVDTDNLSAVGLYDYIQYLRANQLDDQRYRAAFWSHVARPVSLLAMLLLALPFVFGPLRSSSTGYRLMVGMLIGIGFYVFNSIFMESGVVFGLNPLVTAWLPTVLLSLTGLIALQRVR